MTSQHRDRVKDFIDSERDKFEQNCNHLDEDTKKYAVGFMDALEAVEELLQ